MFLHAVQEFDNDLGARADQDLTFSGFFGVVDGIERIVEDAGLDHYGGGARFSARLFEVRYLQVERSMSAIKSSERKECPRNEGSKALVRSGERELRYIAAAKSFRGAHVLPLLRPTYLKLVL